MDSKGLTNGQMRDFVRNGIALDRADFSDPVHADICSRLHALYDAEGNPGNNLLPSVPEIRDVFAHPDVDGALSRILGPGYRMHAHRHGHRTLPGSKPQGWHKDSYVYDPVVRHPRPRFLLVMYYPQDVTLDMGPTGVIPGLQAIPGISDPDQDRTTEPNQTPLCVPAGTVAIVHNDAWHCAMANLSDRPRFMLKFLFERLDEPGAGWAEGVGDWESDDSDPLDAMHADVWRFLHGQSDAGARSVCQASAGDALGRISDPDPVVALRAAYGLASQGDSAVGALIDALRVQAGEARSRYGEKSPGDPHGINPHAPPAASGLASLGRGAVDALGDLLSDTDWGIRWFAADTLGNIGSGARPIWAKLVGAASDVHPRVRRHAIEALGCIGATEEAVLHCLEDSLEDPEVAVRTNAALSLAKLGVASERGVAALGRRLRDPDRYVRAVAVTALRRIGSDSALDMLLSRLETMRWCDLTTRKKPF